jgi:hypothetical protein
MQLNYFEHVLVLINRVTDGESSELCGERICSKKVKVNVYAGSHRRALRKGSQLVLTLARAPPETRKKRNNRDY